jgi:hypothetical protein
MARKRKPTKKPKRHSKKSAPKLDANQIAFKAVSELTADK